MSKEKCVDSVDIIEFLKTIRTLVVQVRILEDLNVPKEQKNITRKALKTLVDTTYEYLKDGTKE